MRSHLILALALTLAATASAEEAAISFVAENPCRGVVATSRGEIPFSTDTPLLLDLPRPAHLTFRSGDCWIAPVTLSPEKRRLEVRAWRAATLRGTLSVPPREQFPQSLAIAITIDGTTSTTDCSVEDARWRCIVPDAKADFRIAADGYAPHYMRALHVRGELDAGELALRPGASISGSIESVRGARIELRPETLAPVEADGWHASPSPEGFFQFTGVAPGTYEVRATAPEHSPSRVRSLVVGESREYVVPPMKLERPISLRVQITPPADAMQRPWTVLLERSDGTRTTPVAETAADVTGWWESEPVVHGLYYLAVRDANGGRMYSERLEITSATGVVEVRLKVIRVRGSVTSGVKPFRAKLDFHQTGGRSVMTDTDADGNYAALLPSDGKWHVRIKAPDERFYLLQRDIEVTPRDDGNPTVLDLRLSGGRIRGKIVDRDGEPVQGDVVVYRDRNPEADAGTDSEGEFELTGVAPGPVLLRAVTPEGESGLVPYDVSENGSATARLVVGKQQRVAGWLATPDGRPIAGAILRYIGTSFIGIRETSTGPHGQFSFRVPGETATLTIASLVPGLPIRLQTVVVDGREVQLTAGTNAARLLLSGRSGPMPMLLSAGNLPFPFSALIFPPDGSGRPPRELTPEGLTIDLEPGTYQVCRQDLSRCLPADLTAGRRTTVDMEALR